MQNAWQRTAGKIHVSFSRHDMIFWIFSCCSLSRVLHVSSILGTRYRSSPSAFNAYGWSVDQLIFSLLTTPCWRDPARSKQLSTVAILGFQFGLYHVVVPLSYYITRDTPHNSDKNYSPIEDFLWARCILDQKIKQEKERLVVYVLISLMLGRKHCCRG